MKSAKQARSTKSRSSPTAAQTRREAGAAAVEFVLVLPILLALVFGIVNFGFIFAAQISLNSSARDAARAGVVKPLASTGTALTCSQIAANARAFAATIGLDTNKIKITVSSITAAGTTGTCTSPKDNGAETGDTAKTLCTQPTTPIVTTQIKVYLEYTAVSPVPYVPPSQATLTATGVFQCEYI
jgi:Flp pilus assembly protein TadG